MSTRHRRIRMGLAVAVLVVALPAVVVAQGPTTGSITGTVTDNTGGLLPGLTVTATGPNLLGTQTAVTDKEGHYRFPALPPGTYKLTYELAGFATLIREGIVLTIGFTATVQVRMELASVQETVTVSGASPVVDTQNSNIKNSFTSDMLANIPNARDIWSLIAEAPGMTVTRFDVGGSTAGTQTGYSSYGLSGQNRVQIAGVNTTEGTGSAGYYYDYGAFEEVSLGTSNAADAEMPVPGLVLNAVLKSGGNQVHGDLYVDYENESLQGQNVDDRLANLGVGQGARVTHYYDPNFSLGGPIMREKLWYFASIRYQEIATTATGWPFEAPGTGPDFLTRLENLTYKLTYQINNNNKISNFIQWGGKQQPYRTAGATTSRDAVANQDDGAWAGNVEWNRIVGPRFFFDVRGSTFGYNWPLLAWGPDGESRGNYRYRMNDLYTGNTAGAYNPYRFDRRRYQFDVTGNLFRDRWAGGDHALKFGFLTELESGQETYSGYRDSIRLLYRSTSGVDFTMPYRVELYNHPTKLTDKAWHHGAFVQDQIAIGKRLSLRLGLRWDYYSTYQPDQQVRPGPYRDFFYAGVPVQTSAGAFSLPRASFADSWEVLARKGLLVYKAAFAPRFGLSWDLGGNGRSVVKANWGRFYSNPSVSYTDDTNPMQSTYATFGWNDLNADRLFTMNELGPFVSLSGGVQNSVQPDIGHPYTDETSFWFERQVATDLGARAGVVFKKINSDWDLIDVGRPRSLWTVPIRVTDPGLDGVTGTADDSSFTAYSLSAVTVSRFQWRAPEDNDSTYKSLDLTLTKRMSKRWSLITSFLYTWRNEHWFGSPQNPNEDLNNDTDTTMWAFKALGTYQAPYGIVITPVLRHQAGTPVPRRVNASTNGGTFPMLVEPSGSYRQDNVTIFDTRVEKYFLLKGARRLGVFADFFNINNSNAAQNQESLTGLRTVVLPDKSTKAVTRFLYPTTIIGPRIVRFGVKFSF